MSAIPAEVQPLPAAEATAPPKCHALGQDETGRALVCWKPAGHVLRGDPWHLMLPMTAPIPIRKRDQNMPKNNSAETAKEAARQPGS
jgi:hypothetical protein